MARVLDDVAGHGRRTRRRGRAARICAPLWWAIARPAWAHAHDVSPEQSKPDARARRCSARYGTPSWVERGEHAPPGGRDRPSPTRARSGDRIELHLAGDAVGGGVAGRRRRRRSRRACRWRSNGVERRRAAPVDGDRRPVGEWWSPDDVAPCDACRAANVDGAGGPGETAASEAASASRRRGCGGVWSIGMLEAVRGRSSAGSPNIGGGICSRAVSLAAKPTVMELQRSTRTDIISSLSPT